MLRETSTDFFGLDRRSMMSHSEKNNSLFCAIYSENMKLTLRLKGRGKNEISLDRDTYYDCV